MKVEGRRTLHTREVSRKNLFQNKQVSWKVGEAWGAPKSRSAPACGQMRFGWKPGFRRENGFKSTEKRLGRAGHSLPGLRSQTPLHSSADSAAALLSGEDSLLCRHRREPCFSPTCWQFSEMQGTPGQKQASWSLKNPPYFLSFGKKAECGPGNSPICQYISHLVLPFHTVSESLWFYVVHRTRSCGMCGWEIFCDVNCWDSSLNVSVFLIACCSVMFLLRGTVYANWNPSLWNPPFMKSIFSLLF